MLLVILLMTIFSSSFVEISCGENSGSGELNESKRGRLTLKFPFSFHGPRLLNHAGNLSCSGSAWKNRKGI
jgi:hypothetical protein